jgi:hypothetical protein
MKFNVLKATLAGLVFTVSCLVNSANAGLIVSGEIRNIDGDNDSAIDDSLISQISFYVSAGTSLTIDSLVREINNTDLNGDGEITGFDNFMRLFAGTTYLTGNDDYSTTGRDSLHRYDSLINYTFATAGTYMVTVGQLSYSTQEALQGYDTNRLYNNRESGGELDHGDWRLTFTANGGSVSNVNVINGVSQVPEPSTLAIFALGMIGLVSRRFKKQS